MLVLDPEGAAAKMAEMRFAAREDDGHESDRIRSALRSFSDLQEIAPARVEIRTINFLFDYAAYLIDPRDQDAVVYVERYTYKIAGGHFKPKYVFTSGDKEWFKQYSTEIAELWEDGTPWSPPDGDEF